MVDLIIDQVRDHKYQRRDLDGIEGLMVHRCGVDLRAGMVIGYDGVSICDAFTGKNPRWESVAKVTGHQNPYTFLIGGNVGPAAFDGKVWQALPLDEIGHHGLRFSRGHIGIGLIGDFRTRVASETQLGIATDLCADLCLMLGLISRRVVGHGEIRGAHKKKGPGQPGACPGDFLSMDSFRSSVREQMRAKLRQDAKWRLEQVGVQLP
jgi:hypothetical protein